MLWLLFLLFLQNITLKIQALKYLVEVIMIFLVYCFSVIFFFRALLPVLHHKSKKGPPRQAKYAIHCIHAIFSSKETQFAQIFEVKRKILFCFMLLLKKYKWVYRMFTFGDVSFCNFPNLNQYININDWLKFENIWWFSFLMLAHSEIKQLYNSFDVTLYI